MMLGASCYLSGFMAFSVDKYVVYVNFSFMMGLSAIFLLYFSWTAFYPIVAKNRVFD